jgi:hypothetical protein
MPGDATKARPPSQRWAGLGSRSCGCQTRAPRCMQSFLRPKRSCTLQGGCRCDAANARLTWVLSLVAMGSLAWAGSQARDRCAGGWRNALLDGLEAARAEHKRRPRRCWIAASVVVRAVSVQSCCVTAVMLAFAASRTVREHARQQENSSTTLTTTAAQHRSRQEEADQTWTYTRQARGTSPPCKALHSLGARPLIVKYLAAYFGPEIHVHQLLRTMPMPSCGHAGPLGLRASTTRNFGFSSRLPGT